MIGLVPTSLDLQAHLDAIEAGGTRLIELAVATGLGAAVPTCPSWDVGNLVAHQAMVHRWATAHVLGDDPAAVPDEATLRTQVGDLPAYFRHGLRGLIEALRDAPADLEAMTFLNDAPSPREFWARRQAHETTIHMIDALAASLGRLPTAEESAIPTSLAVDGTDELLRGFLTRGFTKLAADTPYTVVVEPTDIDQRWVLRVADTLAVDAPGAAARDAAVRLTGTAAEIYRSLWNRGGDIELHGDPGFLERWRSSQRVRWG